MHFITFHATKYSTIRGVFLQPWPGVSPTAIVNEEKALGTRLDSFSDPTCSFPAPRFLSNMCICYWKRYFDLLSGRLHWKNLTTKNSNDSRQGNLRSLHVVLYENWSDKMGAWQQFLRSDSEKEVTQWALLWQTNYFRNGDVHPLECNFSVLGLFRNNLSKAT